jgi:hypothetical protein
MSKLMNQKYALIFETNKTQNLIINLENDDWILKDDQTLEALGCGGPP